MFSKELCAPNHNHEDVKHTKRNSELFMKESKCNIEVFPSARRVAQFLSPGLSRISSLFISCLRWENRRHSEPQISPHASAGCSWVTLMGSWAGRLADVRAWILKIVGNACYLSSNCSSIPLLISDWERGVRLWEKNWGKERGKGSEDRREKRW